jgi:hypothetical protein
VVACRDDQQGGHVGAGAVQLEQAGRLQFDQGEQEPIEGVDLGGQELRSSPQLGQGDAGGVSDRVAPTGSQRGQLDDEIVGAVVLGADP